MQDEILRKEGRAGKGKDRKNGKTGPGQTGNSHRRRICRMLLCIACFLLLPFLLAVTVHGAQEVTEDEWNAISFYQKYGSRNMVFSNGAFFYGSKGKAGKDTGIRYGVEGQRFTLILSDGKRFECSVALSSDYNTGSCKRISYMKSGEYYYSLYQVSYKTLLEKFSERYRDTDFQELMYNHTLQYQVDFYLSLVREGEPMGIVKEQKDGSLVLEGTVYQDYEGISSAASWSLETRKILPDYFGIRMSVYQASAYTICYKAIDGEISGRMTAQAVRYGDNVSLSECGFEKNVTLQLNNAFVSSKAEMLMLSDFPDKSRTESRKAKAEFLGWALAIGQGVKYQDKQVVQNLSGTNGAEIILYAVFGKAVFKLPDEDAFDLKEVKLVGYSKSPQGIQPAGEEDTVIKKVIDYEPGSELRISTSMVLYAVYQERDKMVKLTAPDYSLKRKKVFTYTRKELQTIRSEIQNSGFPGRKVIERLIKH